MEASHFDTRDRRIGGFRRVDVLLDQFARSDGSLRRARSGRVFLGDALSGVEDRAELHEPSKATHNRGGAVG